MPRRRTTRWSGTHAGSRGHDGRPHASLGLARPAPRPARRRTGTRPRGGQPPGEAGLRVLRPPGSANGRSAVRRRRARGGRGRGGRASRGRFERVPGARRGRRSASCHRPGRRPLPRCALCGNGSRRDHRNQRQDHGRPLRRPCFRGHRAWRRSLRGHGNPRPRDPGGPRGRAAYHPGCPRRAREARHDAALRRAPGGDGGLVARHRAGPGRGRPFPGRLPHQCRARPPRLPRGARRRTRRRSGGCSPGRSSRRRSSTRTTGSDGRSSRRRMVRPSGSATRSTPRTPPCAAGSNRGRPDRTRLEVAHGRRRAVVDSPLVGRFNAYNLLAGLAVLIALNVPLERAAAGLAAAEPPRGRLQPVRLGSTGPVGAPGLRRLRPHAGRAERGARLPPAGGEGRDLARVRMRRRARPRQAPAHGSGPRRGARIGCS